MMSFLSNTAIPFICSEYLQNFAWYTIYFGAPIVIILMCNTFIRIYIGSKNMAALKGQVCVITGASSGIGKALAHVFYEKGSKVVLASRRKIELEMVKQALIHKKLSTPTLEPVVLELDLDKHENVESFVKKVYDACGHIDILINNGGIYHYGSVANTILEVYKKVMAVNYFGSVALTKACLPKMIERQSGHIVFVSSVQGLISIPDHSAYSASKHALQAFGDSLRAEIDHYNIDVTVISPGYVNTDISMNAITGSGDSHGVMDPDIYKGFTAEYCAQKIMDAINSKQKEYTICQLLATLAIFGRHNLPSLYFWFMARRAEKTT